MRRSVGNVCSGWGLDDLEADDSGAGVGAALGVAGVGVGSTTSSTVPIRRMLSPGALRVGAHAIPPAKKRTITAGTPVLRHMARMNQDVARRTGLRVVSPVHPKRFVI